MAKRVVFIILIIECLLLTGAQALERSETEFKIFQFPPTMIPRIDGDTSDWDIVPDSYLYGSDQLSDTVKGHGTDIDTKDLDVKVRVGWVEVSFVLPTDRNVSHTCRQAMLHGVSDIPV